MDRTIISFTWVALAAMAASAASPAQPGAVPDLDNRPGQPVDMASWAYAWRADREVQEKPEASFIPRRLKRLDEVYRTVASQTPETEQDKKRIEEYKKLGLLPAPKGRLFSALLWLAPVPTQRIELRWPAGDAVPPVEAIEVRVYPATAGWFGVVRDEPLAAPAISADGHTLTYLNEQPDGPAKGKVIFQPTDMVAVFFDPAKAPANAKYGCPSIHLYPPSRTWSTLDLEIEWGCTEDSEQKVFDGRIEVYGGSVTSVKPLPEDKGTTTTGPDAWKSAAAAGSPRRGIAVSVLHPGRFGSRGEKRRISPLDTRITLWTKSGNLTFLPDDVNHGPILVPEHGVFIAKAGSGKTGRAFAAELAAKGPRSVLDVIRRHKEIASCEEALRQIKVPGCKEGTDLWELVPFEEPPAGAMLVQVPDERWNDAWRRATHQLRVYKGGYQQLSFEAAPMLYAADLVGAHETTAKRFDYWLNCPGTVKPDGDFVDGDGSFEYGKTMRYDIGWYHDGTHTGTWLILRTMADRCLLTGDTAWLEKNLPRMQKAADWIIRQRRQYMADVPGRDRLWAAGLLPPQVLGDTYLGKCLWLWYINSDAHAVQALQRFAEAVDAVDPALAKRYREEAEAYRQDLLRAVERELALSPVRLTRDGTYRCYMPTSMYRRGSMQGESFGIYGEADYGHGVLPLFLGGGLLPADDPRLSGHLEIVEEAHLNKAVTKTRKDRGLAEEDDVFFNGIAGLPKASLVAQTHFRRDDIGPFLRFWMNNYAAFVQPGGGLTEGFQHGSGCGGTANNGPSGDLGSTAWFIEQFRNLLVWEDGGTLWLGRGTPRAWLEQGKKISVKDAPTRFGAVAYEIVSDADKGSITATIQMPARKPPQEVVLRFRHPTSAPIKGVTVNGKPWTGFNKEKETITLEGLTGSVNVTAQY